MSELDQTSFLWKDYLLSIDLIPYNTTITTLQNILISSVELLSETDLKILEIVKKVNEIHNTSYVVNTFTKDIYHYSANIISKFIGLENIKEKYEDDYEKVQERMFFRFELYKEGWEPEKIEHYICNHLLKCDYHNTDKELIYNMYHNIMETTKNKHKYKNRKVGRPNLPQTLKLYLKEKHSQKTRKNMEVTYDYSKKYKQIKDNLLTDKESEFLCNYLKTFPDNISFNEATTIIEKLRNLKITCN